MTPTIDDVMCAAGVYYPGLERGWLVADNRARRVSWPRNVAMTVARRVTGKSLPQIGRKFSRDHTSILAAVRATEGRAESRPEIMHAIVAITALAHARAEFRSHANKACLDE